jgi:D-amino-acid dehydrogenase
MTKRKDVVVIGGGVIGLACAYYLAATGRSVHIVERERVGSGASHGNCGLLFFSDLPPLCQPGAVTKELPHLLDKHAPLFISLDFDLPKLLWLLRFAAKCNPTHLRRAVIARENMLRCSQRLFEELIATEDLSCDWHRQGILLVYKKQKDMDGYLATNAILAPYGLAAKALSGAELTKMEPALRPDLCGAWHHEIDSHVRPEKLVEGLHAAVQRQGVAVEEHCAVTALEQSEGRITAVVTERGRLTADTFVLAAGAWTPSIAKSVGLRIPIQPAKGYSLTLHRPPSCPSHPCYFYGSRVVATPWSDGLRLGGTMEFSGLNTHLDRGRLANLTQAAREYLRHYPETEAIEEWVGMRPMTYDDLPIIGRAPVGANLFLAGGHGMMGITMATGTGRLLADLVVGAAPIMDPTPFGPDRFR